MNDLLFSVRRWLARRVTAGAGTERGWKSDYLLHFYVAFIRPILEYCSPVWNHNLPQYLLGKIESIQKRAIHIIFLVTRGMSYIFALSYAELTSLQQRRETLAKELFVEICTPTSCLHYLLCPPCDQTLSTRLRNPRKYPTPDGRTKKYQSFVNFALKYYQ